tara:strand:+ start:209 stop:475 length:267 start_codon:yes stop_codon:yes gene_type:complete
MSWFDILKIEKPKGKEDYLTAMSRRMGKEPSTKNLRFGNRKEGSRSSTFKCDLCGKRTHERNRHESSINSGSNYCKKCAKFRDASSSS